MIGLSSRPRQAAGGNVIEPLGSSTELLIVLKVLLQPASPVRGLSRGRQY